MVNTIVNNKTKPNFTENIGKVLFVLSGIFLFIAALNVFQDFLESRRSGFDFNFNESILFKTVWFVFIPILVILYQKLKNERLDSYTKTTIFIVFAIAIHLLILPFVAVVFSVLFYEGRYDLYKFFSYTLAHDLYKLVIVYTSFVLGYKYFSNRTQRIDIKEIKPKLNTIVINNGKENVIVNVEDIVQITSATPYISIHLESKRYLHSETLKSICKQLDSNVFVRVHKSTVVNILKTNSFKSRLNGDYDLLLKSGELVRLSRTYATDFKNHFNASQRVNV
ncbi:LytR/AlgR family response regulator transcription factor [Gelidibacter japonicus]|uniref:LytR/AlgR family response regulator transcription factor n=1 Tax=Gelidibacter japonicus TaxID=1962232 RepID=UPI0013D7D497|nr:LytTR family DNA-binding domain-containing protein [Gelidibacter japonicus]MCL8009349.1 LytTR family transcriptional regulator [Gelidibacter japonicus]